MHSKKTNMSKRQVSVLIKKLSPRNNRMSKEMQDSDLEEDNSNKKYSGIGGYTISLG